MNKAIKGGIGETFKEGEKLINIMPSNYQLAVEMYVRPIDLPLIHIGENVRIQFDGWPAIVFSGWPNVSYGTYGAKVIAIENFISDNGMYRVLLAPDKDDHEWPDAIRVGSGTKNIALLDNVPIWFELWRQINSFPPNFISLKELQKLKLMYRFLLFSFVYLTSCMVYSQDKILLLDDYLSLVKINHPIVKQANLKAMKVMRNY